MSCALLKSQCGAGEVRAAVEAALGAPIPASSVNEALSTHARGADLRFRRVAYGVYEYRSAPNRRPDRQAELGSNLADRVSIPT